MRGDYLPVPTNAKTKYGFTRQYHISLTYAQIKLYQQAIATQNALFQYALKYWYKTYGRKHLGRPLPQKVGIKYMNNRIKAMFIKEKYDLSRWNVRKLGLSSHAADEFLKTCWTNFTNYHRHLVKASKMSDKEKYNYRMNITKDKFGKHKNPQHRSWYRKGSLNFLRNNKSFKTITSQKLPNGQTKLISPHHINLADFGDVIVFENLRNINFKEVALTKIKQMADGTFRLQLTFTRKKTRQKSDKIIGLDWNMANNEVYRSSENRRYFLAKKVVELANKYEQQINEYKSLRDLEKNKQKRITHKVEFYDRRQRKLAAKREHLLTNEYRHLVHRIVDHYDTLIIEDIDAYEMRKKSLKLSKEQNKGKNRRLALLKPFEMMTILESLVDKQNKTLIKVDAYKTSQVCHNCGYVNQNLKVGQKEWQCFGCQKLNDRDYNAALNIKEWGLEPEKHQKVKDFPKVKASYVSQIC